MNTTSRRAKIASLFALLMVGALVSESALAQHRHFRGGPRVGVYIGAPVIGYGFYRPYYYPPYYYPPAYYPPAYYPPVAVAPPVYVEQPQVQQSVPVQPPAQLYQPDQQPQPQMQPQSQPQGSMWYYCEDSRAYYPYVKSCPNGWREVTPQPQG